MSEVVHAIKLATQLILSLMYYDISCREGVEDMGMLLRRTFGLVLLTEILFRIWV